MRAMILPRRSAIGLRGDEFRSVPGHPRRRSFPRFRKLTAPMCAQFLMPTSAALFDAELSCGETFLHSSSDGPPLSILYISQPKNPITLGGNPALARNQRLAGFPGATLSAALGLGLPTPTF